jgi:hypothetical protein
MPAADLKFTPLALDMGSKMSQAGSTFTVVDMADHSGTRSGPGAEISAPSRVISSVDVNRLDHDELATALLQTEMLINAAHALSAELMERFARVGRWADDGALSAAAWMAERTGTARANLWSRLRQGEAMAELPAIASEARAGRMSTDHLRAIGECAHRRPALAARDEQLWMEQAATLGAEGFRIATRRWLDLAADATAPDPGDRPVEEVSRLHASRTLEGWLRVDGLFAPHDADLLEAVLDAGVDRALRDAHDGDPSVTGRPVSALRAAALVDVAAQAMRREPSDLSVPDRYRVAVVVQHDAPAVPEAGCDATAYRVVLGARREVLDVGRQTSRWPVAIRRAITVRDRGCIFPGCDRPPGWTDIHHCKPWHEGGTTAVDNGALLCRRHHTFIHQHRWRVTLDGGIPTTRRPDGTRYLIERWAADPGAA